MSTVTVSPKFQVVIPKEIREKLGIMPGQKIHAVAFEDRVELIPVQPASVMRGFVKGLDTRLERDDDRV
ncbi:MAG: AbrB/MazE/SpoVT family DNA-binding domain-containing protein [Gemmatimonadaceae bacterium]